VSSERKSGSSVNAGHSGVYLAPADTSALRRTATRGGVVWMELDSREAQNKAQFLAACARDLQFPGWFGGNWDALADCLQDFSWRPAPGHVVLWRGASRFARAAPDDFAQALEIFRDAAIYWKTGGGVFIALLDQQPRGAAVQPFPGS
jgi:RNAse (barnase) inhibitor barstar